MKILDAPVYSQRDAPWAGEHYGLPQAARSSTIDKFGCGITCIAQKLTLVGFLTTPIEVQRALAQRQAFKPYGSFNFIDWAKVPLVYPQLKWMGRSDVTTPRAPQRVMDQITLGLLKNDYPILYVDAQRYVAGLQQHFVLVIGQMESGDLLIANPWNGQVQDLRPYADTDAQAVRGLLRLDLNVDPAKAM